MDEQRAQRETPTWFRYIPIAGGALVVVVVTVALIWFIRGMDKKTDGPKRQTAQVVKLIRPPPPPPEQPPPPPPDKAEQPIPQDTPTPTPQQDSPAEQLGVDADASAGGDGFGLAARKGGRDLLASGIGVFASYTGMVSNTVRDVLSEDKRVRNGTYAGEVRLWVASDGRVERAKLARTTGNLERDAAIEEDMKKIRFREAPPIEMPQPITLKVGSRG